MKALDILIYILQCGGMIHVDRGFMSNVSKAVEELKEHLSDKDDQTKWLREELKYHKAELEALRTKSCDGCKYYTSTLCPVEEFSITSAELEKHPFYCNRHKPKE